MEPEIESNMVAPFRDRHSPDVGANASKVKKPVAQGKLYIGPSRSVTPAMSDEVCEKG
jgi:hypothetical protein